MSIQEELIMINWWSKEMKVNLIDQKLEPYGGLPLMFIFIFMK